MLAHFRKFTVLPPRQLLSVAIATLSAVAVPFIITALFRALPGIPVVLPFVLVSIIGGAAILAHPRARARAFGSGLLLGTVVYAAFLWYLLVTFEVPP